MTFLLSIFLCFALAFSGTGTLPAEPEAATTWTVRSISLDNGTETYTIDPELRLTTAIGAEKADLHFEIDSGNRALIPVSAELTSDELRFSMGNGGRAYTLTNEEFLRLADIDPEDLQVLTVVGDFFTSYGALLGSVYGDEQQAAVYSKAVFQAMINACSGDFEQVEIELNGETVEAQRAELNMTFDATFKLLDELRACGIEPMEKLMDSMLALCCQATETEYADFASLAAEIDEDIDFSMPMTVTFAAADDLAYCLMECDFAVEDSTAQMREEVTYDGEWTIIEATMDMINLSPDTDASYVISAQMAGPLNAPTSVHVSYDIVMTSEVQIVYEAEDADDDAEIAADPDSFIDQTEIHMTFDSAATDGLNDAQFVVNFQELIDDEEQSSGVFHLASAQRREDDGSVTADVTIRFLGEDSEVGISFELNRAEAAPADYFDGLKMYELTAEEFYNADDEPSELMSALQNDATLMALDAMQLTADESVQALVSGVQSIGID